MTPQEFVTELGRENRESYGRPDQLSSLRVIELNFENPWIYVFELLQNAIDAGARHVAFSISEDGDRLLFEHNGTAPLGEEEVRGLSKIFRSTKGATTVGFMGIGFKSVFTRFRQCEVSTRDYTFKYVIDTFPDALGATQIDLLGAVVPVWDDAIPKPSGLFTTRFALSRRAERMASLAGDLEHLLQEDSGRGALPILAWAGIERIDVNRQIWHLSAPPERDRRTSGSDATVVASCGATALQWKVLAVSFVPSDEAVREFLEHRRIVATEENKGALLAAVQRPRPIIGVVPLDANGDPDPPERGRVYATLPTNVTVPFGLDIHADWFLGIQRTGLREIEDNAWQRDIIRSLPQLLQRYLRWVASACASKRAAQKAHSALRVPSKKAKEGLERLLSAQSWLKLLGDQLRNEPVLPVADEEGHGHVRYAVAANVVLPPKALSDALDDVALGNASALLGKPAVDREVLGAEALRLFAACGLLTEMDREDLERAWAGGLEDWWTSLADHKERHKTLFRLWGGVAALSRMPGWNSQRLSCVRVEDGTWVPAHACVYFDEKLPLEDEPGGQQVRQALIPALPPKRVADRWIGELRHLGQQGEPYRLALTWFENRAEKRQIQPLLLQVFDQAAAQSADGLADVRPESPVRQLLLALGEWAFHRRRHAFLTHVLAESPGGERCILTSQSLLADPYVVRGDARRLLFADCPAISAEYLRSRTERSDALSWAEFLETAGAKGALSLKESIEEFRASQGITVGRRIGAKGVGAARPGTRYKVTDLDIEVPLPVESDPIERRLAFANWLEEEYRRLVNKDRLEASWSSNKRHTLTGTSPCRWVTRLESSSWVPCRDGGFRKPSECLAQPDLARAEAPTSGLSVALAKALADAGVRFGSDIPQAPAVQRLQAGISDAPTLAAILRELRTSSVSADDRARAVGALAGHQIRVQNGSKVPLARVVRTVASGARSSLRGWVVSASDLDPDLQMELLHPDSLWPLPEKTTGEQALRYVEEVWRRARTAPQGLANEVGESLPLAYDYISDDAEDDPGLEVAWRKAAERGVVFAGKTWRNPGEDGSVYFDDIRDRLSRQLTRDLDFASAGHLGSSFERQKRVAADLHASLLSEIIVVKPVERGLRPPPDRWRWRFGELARLLREVRSAAEGGEAQVPERLQLAERLSLTIAWKDGSSAKEVEQSARIQSGELIVVGSPLEFASEATHELFGCLASAARGVESALLLTACLAALDHPTVFSRALRKASEILCPTFEMRPDPSTAEASPTEAEPLLQPLGPRKKVGVSGAGGPQAPGGPTPWDTPASPGGSHTDGAAFSAQKRLGELIDQLRRVIKGELELGDADPALIQSEADPIRDGDHAPAADDAVFRRAVLEYERRAGRIAEEGLPGQEGWDIRSSDPNGRTRLIEVKGRSLSWLKNEVVELTREQVRTAVTISNADWYLYVVEKTPGGTFRVLPIPNPPRKAAKWILRANEWRLLAETEIAGSDPRAGDTTPGEET